MRTLNLLDFIETPAFALLFTDGQRPTIAFWNSRAEGLTGLGRDEVVGRCPADVMGTLAEPLMAARWTKESGQVRIEGLGAVTLVALPDGKTVIASIITAAQEAADREREMFLGLATHDIRSPLRNIGFLCEELLVDFPDPGDGRNRLVRNIRTISSNAAAMTEEVLTAVQAASLQETAAIEVDLSTLSDLIFVTLDPSGRHRLSAASKVLMTDRPVMQTVLRNLVDNAIRHGGQGSLTIHVDAENRRDGKIALSVTDDGKGFSDASIAFLSGGELRQDSGFGLYGLNRILKKRGGEITVVRSPGGAGSVVTATLPGQVVEAQQNVSRAS